MKQKIITDINILKQKSEEVTLLELQNIIKDLEDTLKEYKGYGLAAVQIGVLKRVGIIRFGNKKIDLINPVILEKNEKFRHREEGCLSIPGLRVDTIRYADIIIENGIDVDRSRFALYGLEALVCQHEIAHMNGRTILDDKWRKRR